MNFLGVKKIFLKGKDFVMKKLDDLQIQRQEIDYVAQQIPKRLHAHLKVFERAEIDLEPAQDYAPYFKIYPTHPVAPMLYDSITKDKTEVKYELSTLISAHETQIPLFNSEQQQKAFRLKNTLDNYCEEIPKVQNSIICICVVNFHHKIGTEVEFCYPETDLTKSLESRVVYYAMPDSSHNKHEDYSFFNLQTHAQIQSQRKMLFGVSYFKQIKVTEEMRKDQEELTRSHLQKAVCIISALPVFGYLRLRLAQATKLFFDNTTNFETIKCAYQDISKHLNDTWQNLHINQLYIGSDLRNIVGIFGTKLMEIYKAILYQKRVVIFSHSSSSSSSFILSVLTLFPGMSTFGMSSRPINKYYESLRQYALPLRLFSRKNPLILSFHIQEFHLLDGFDNPKGRHYLVGTTNRLVKQSKKFSIQVLLNLQDCTLQTSNIDEGGWEGLTSADKQFINRVTEVVAKGNTEGYQGSQDWIRQQFHSYLKQNLVKIVEAKNLYRKFAKDCQSYQACIKNRIRDQKGRDPTAPSTGMPYVDSRILEIPLSPLFQKPSFSYFLQFHNPSIYLLTNQYPVDCILLLGTNEAYLGRLPRKGNTAITYNQNAKILKYQNPQDPQFAKQVRFNNDNEIVNIHIGKYLSNQMIHGFKLSEEGVYTGDFKDGSYHGYGKLSTPTETYIGNFKDGLYHGQGQLVVSKTKCIYCGQFKQGQKDGKGRQQSSETTVTGMFKHNMFSGQGQISYLSKGVQIQGSFNERSIDENNQYIYTFANKDVFLGRVRGMEPFGQGIYTRVNKQPVKAKFQDGQLHILDQLAEDRQQQSPVI